MPSCGSLGPAASGATSRRGSRTGRRCGASGGGGATLGGAQRPGRRRRASDARGTVSRTPASPRGTRSGGRRRCSATAARLTGGSPGSAARRPTEPVGPAPLAELVEAGQLVREPGEERLERSLVDPGRRLGAVAALVRARGLRRTAVSPGEHRRCDGDQPEAQRPQVACGRESSILEHLGDGDCAGRAQLALFCVALGRSDTRVGTKPWIGFLHDVEETHRSLRRATFRRSRSRSTRARVCTERGFAVVQIQVRAPRRISPRGYSPLRISHLRVESSPP